MNGNFEDITSWDSLPDIVLSEIFTNLDDSRDRFNASLVSKSWSRAFRSPELWRKMELKLPSFSTWGEKFVTSLGEYVEELEIRCCWDSRQIRTNRELFLNNILAFLIILTKKPMIRLEKFEFTNLNLYSTYSAWKDDWRRGKVVKLILEFLGKQNNMAHFVMRSCKASPEVGMEFLVQLAKNNSRSLKILHLDNFFTEKSEVLSCPDYQEVMGNSFTSLVEIQIDCNCIDSKILGLMVEKCRQSLKVLILRCRYHNSIDVVQNSNWERIRKMYDPQQLEVRLDIDDIEEFRDYSQVFPLDMELHTLQVWLTGSTLYEENVKSLLLHLCQFRNTLVNLTLNYYFVIRDPSLDPPLDGLLINLLSTCRPKLKSFCLMGDCSIQRMKTLCEMQKKGEIQLENCKFLFFDYDQNRTSIQEIVDLYQPVFNNLSCAEPNP